MGYIELLLLAVGLSMDAFAVSICKGLAARNVSIREMVLAGVWFGGFQAFMPLFGFFLGTTFKDLIMSFDHWVAFGLLVLIGGNMIRESFSKEEAEDASFEAKKMFVLAIATSIDALAIGITFAVLPGVKLIGAISIIGVVTFAFSAFGVKVGRIFGTRYKSKAEFVGGVILCLIGLRILIEHLGILA